MPAPSPAEQQRIYARLAALSERELAGIWRGLNLAKPDRLADPLAEVLAVLVEKYGSAGATLAADWYDEARDDAKAAGTFRAMPATPPEPERVQALARWGVGPLFGANPNGVTALSLLAGGLQREVLKMPRSTVEGSATLDPAGPSYARHASANACAFCRMLATRGAVYTSKDAAERVTGQNLGGTDYRKMRQLGTPRGALLAGLRQSTRDRGGRKLRDTIQPLGDKYHDRCHCVSVAVWPGQTFDEAPYVQQWRQQYNDSIATHGAHGAIDPKATLANWRDEFGAH